MDTNKTRIEASKIQALLVASGLKLTPQKGFVRVDGTGEGNRIYVAFTKTVARIDIAGFTMSEADGSHKVGYCTPHCGPFGSVHQQVDFSRTESEILDTLKELLAELATRPAAPKVEKQKVKTAKAANPNAAWSPDLAEARKARLDAIRLANEQKRKERLEAEANEQAEEEDEVEVDPATLAELDADDGDFASA